MNTSVFILASFLDGSNNKKTFELVLGEIWDFIDEAESHLKHKHIVLLLRGRFKGESGDGFHFVAVSTRTDSELCIRA